jgi:DNA-binding CsgD family transcriptional regulator
MRVNELALSQAVLPSLAKAGIHTVEQLAEQNLGGLLRQPEFRSGVELYELIRELHRHGLTPFAARASHVQTERELEMLRLRVIEGLTLAQIGQRLGIKGERARQLLKLHFGLGGVPPAAKRRPAIKPRPLTLSERRRMYRLARLTVMRSYHRPLPLEEVARTVASSLARCSAPTPSSARAPSTTTA